MSGVSFLPLMKTLSALRWIAGVVVFVAAAVVFGQIVSESRVTPVPSRLAPARLAARLSPSEASKYRPVAVNDPEVQTAIQFALSDQARKNRVAAKMLAVVSAERQTGTGDNVRLCLSMDRHGRVDSTRVIVHRSAKNQWTVTLWAWGACRK